MKYKLKKGQALVIFGEAGAGKSKLAQEVARDNGTYQELRFADLKAPYTFGKILREKPDTLIVEECIWNESQVATAKELISSETIIAQVKGKLAKKVKAPNFIFVSQGSCPIRLFSEDQRFVVVTA